MRRKEGDVCHSSGKASIIANTITPSESPTKLPAMKLPTFESLPGTLHDPLRS